MLPLWPEAIFVGLFPGHCWLQRGRGDTGLVSVPLSSSTPPRELLATLAGMLSSLTPALRKGSRLHILVSDSMSAMVALPWQEQLRAEQEIAFYARACFENQGMPLDEAWIMYAGFRRYRAAGIAYALPQAWLQELLALVDAQGLKLGSVLPVAAAAYWRKQRSPDRGKAVLLLRESRRMTAMLYVGDAWLGFDVEPITSGDAATCTRLLRRVGTIHPEICRVEHWDATPSIDADIAEVVVACLPAAELCQLRHGVWI